MDENEKLIIELVKNAKTRLILLVPWKKYRYNRMQKGSGLIYGRSGNSNKAHTNMKPVKNLLRKLKSLTIPSWQSSYSTAKEPEKRNSLNSLGASL
jgi:hypothetical protein